jgi:hypothetical protein
MVDQEFVEWPNQTAVFEGVVPLAEVPQDPDLFDDDDDDFEMED